MRRQITGGLGAAAAALALAAPGAQAAGLDLSTARFTAQYEASLVTTWNMPRYEWDASCYNRRWGSGQGTETWKIKTRGPQKVLAMRTGPRLVSWLGGWTVGAPPDDIAAAGMISRDSHFSFGSNPGPCGGGVEIDRRPDDCGDRLPSYTVHLSQLGG